MFFSDLFFGFFALGSPRSFVLDLLLLHSRDLSFFTLDETSNIGVKPLQFIDVVIIVLLVTRTIVVLYGRL